MIRWLRRRHAESKRTSWLYCFACGHDLNGDDESFIGETKDRMFWDYICASCGELTRFDLQYPVPVRLTSDTSL